MKGFYLFIYLKKESIFNNSSWLLSRFNIYLWLRLFFICYCLFLLLWWFWIFKFLSASRGITSNQLWCLVGTRRCICVFTSFVEFLYRHAVSYSVGLKWLLNLVVSSLNSAVIILALLNLRSQFLFLFKMSDLYLIFSGLKTTTSMILLYISKRIVMSMQIMIANIGA